MQSNILQSTAFSIGSITFTWLQLVLALVFTVVAGAFSIYIRRRLKKYALLHEVEPKRMRWISILMKTVLILLWILCLVYALGLDVSLIQRQGFDVKITGVLGIICVLLLARIADGLISARILEEMQHRHHDEIFREQYGSKDQRTKITKLIQYCIINLVLIIVLPLLSLNQSIAIHLGESTINISILNILSAFLIILLARLFLWVMVNLFLFGWYKRNRIDIGKQYAYNQLLTYVLYTFAAIIAMKYLGLDFTLLLAASAALLVGIGIALQPIISDFFSGLVILFEQSVEVGDFLDFGGFSGTVKKIGLRASVLETLESKEVIMPNSRLVNDNVTNWTSNIKVTRFRVDVGAAYGSDTGLIKKVLIDSLTGIKGVLQSPKPFIRFTNFGDSSLDFSLFFYSKNVIRIEDIKSDVRFSIDKNFKEHGISIPFPQRDVWIKKE